MDIFVGVDVGGTTSTIAIGNEHREVIAVSDQFATRSVEGPEATIGAVCSELEACVGRLGIAAQDIATVGLATPGPATFDGVLLKTPNLSAELWDRFPIRKELERALRSELPRVDVRYIGDGQAAALGEFAIRTGRLAWRQGPLSGSPESDLASLFMVIVGTGLGGGEVRDGRVVRGREGRAGHVGHLLLPDVAFRYDHDRRLLVGNAMATVESAVSLTGLTHQLGYRLGLDAWKDHPLNRDAASTKDKAKRLRGLADAGDALALELFDDQANALGIALLNVNYLGDFDVLVIGGGVCDLASAVRDRYRKLVADAYRRFALEGFRTPTRFEFSACGDSAPVIGALEYSYGRDQPDVPPG